MVKPASSSKRDPERRLALLKAAFREVAEKGFSDTTLEDIARRAGVSKGVTLYYFESKDELFRDLFSWLIDSIHARMREAVAREEDPVGKVRALSPHGTNAFVRSTPASTPGAGRSTAGSPRRACGAGSLPYAIPGRRAPRCGPSSTV